MSALEILPADQGEPELSHKTQLHVVGEVRNEQSDIAPRTSCDSLELTQERYDRIARLILSGPQTD